MRPTFLAGCALLVLALVAAAAETMAHVTPGVDSLFLSAYEVLYTHWPSKLIVAKIHIERWFGTWAWDPVALGILALPGWLLFGGPGALLAWTGRRKAGGDEEQFREIEDSVFLYDSLARQAREEGYVTDDEPRFEPVYATPDDAEIRPEDLPDDPGTLFTPDDPPDEPPGDNGDAAKPK